MLGEYYLLKDKLCIGRRKTRLFLAFLFLSLATGGHLFAEALGDQTDLVVWDGMEQKGTWHVDGKNKISSSTEYVTEGRSSLEISGGDSIPSSGVTITKENTYLDLSFAKKIVFDVYNSGAPCKMAVAVYAGQRYESIPKEIQSGLNKNVTFEFNAKDFTFILTAESVAQTVEFVVYPEDDTLSSLYVDNVRVKKLGSLESPGIPPTSMGALITEGYTPPETPLPDNTPYTVVAFPHDNPTPINEPKTLFLLGTGVVGLLICKKKGLKR